MTVAAIVFLCVWMFSPSMSRGTGFIYQFPGGTLPRINSEKIIGPPTVMNPSYSRNWCQYTVSKTVSCQVHNGTETLVQRVYQSCRWPGPCSNLIRTLVRPTYRLTYRQVTALEWRCCPGFLGEDCSQECMNCTGYADMSDRLRTIESKILLLEEAGPPPIPIRHHKVGAADNEVGVPKPTPINLPTMGLPGARGPPGPAGPMGVGGSPGPRGEKGLSGVPGPMGTRGPQGHSGPPGERGLPGPAGPPGPASPFSNRGDIFGLRELGQYDEKALPARNTQRAVPGPPGPPGPPGRPGASGPPGRQGTSGRNGVGGLSGKPGDRGPKGEAGERGYLGLKGEKGIPGVPGPKGEPGESLPDGEGVHQLREALKILAERLLILEHMIGIHENPLEPGSGLDILADLLPTFKNKRAGPNHQLHTPSTGNQKLPGEGRVKRGDN